METVIPTYENTTIAGVIPSATVKSGTIYSVSNLVYGLGTRFSVDTPINSYIYFQNQVRKVVSVRSNNIIEINRAFTPDLTASTPLYVINGTLPDKQSIINIGTRIAKLGTIYSDAQQLIVGGRVKYISPTLGAVAYDPNGSILVVTNGEFDMVDLSSAQNSLIQLQTNLDLLNMTSEENIVAFAGGGQAGAYQLTCKINSVNTVVSDGDSVRLPTAIKNIEILVQNNDIVNNKSMDVFPSISDNISGLAINVAFPIVGGNESRFFCYVNGTWTPI